MEYYNRDMCVEGAKDDCNIAGVARLDAWINVVVVFMCDERSMELGDKQKRIQNKY